MTEPSPPAPGLLRRLAAIIYDVLLVLPLIMASVALAMGLRLILSDDTADRALPPWVVQSLAISCCIGFFTIFWLKSGQTLGMQAWRIKLVAMPGNELTFGRAITRCCSALLSAACFGLGYGWSLVDRRHRCWHDYLSGTELILLPPKNKKTSDVSGVSAAAEQVEP